MVTPSTEVEAAIASIRAIDDQFMENVAAKKPALVAGLYADDACILMPGRPIIRGKSQILAFWQAALEGPVQAVTLNTTEVNVSGDMAYALGNNSVMLKPAGEYPRQEKGKYVAVYRRRAGSGWEIVVDSYSNDQG